MQQYQPAISQLKQTSKKVKRKKRYTWNFYRMHPIAQDIAIGLFAGIACKLMINLAWFIAILYDLVMFY